MRVLKTQVEVLEFLQKNFPELHKNAVIEKDWVWIVANLQGEANKPAREALKAFGFAFKFNGDHVLSDGRAARWSHSCMRPIPFHRKGHGTGSPGAASTSTSPTKPALSPEEMLAAIGL